MVEQVTREWLVELLGLPADSSVGFVTGTQMAHVTGLAAARWHVLDAVGWDVGANGLTGAPPRARARRREAARDRRPGAAAARPRRADRGRGRLAGPARARGAARGARRGPDDRLRPGRRGEHRRLRPAAGDRRRLRGGGRVAPRRRRLRHLGRRLAAAAPPRRRPRARRLVDDRRAQVAERPLRLRDRLLQASRVAPRGDDDRRLVPDPGRGRAAGARPGRLGAGVLAPRPRLLGLRRAPLARPQRAGRAGRALLRRRDALRRADRRARRRRAPERGRAQPGALPLRVRRADRRGARARAGERPDLAERHDLGRPQGDPRLGLELADRRRGDRPRRRGVRSGYAGKSPAR